MSVPTLRSMTNAVGTTASPTWALVFTSEARWVRQQHHARDATEAAPVIVLLRRASVPRSSRRKLFCEANNRLALAADTALASRSPSARSTIQPRDGGRISHFGARCGANRRRLGACCLLCCASLWIGYTRRYRRVPTWLPTTRQLRWFAALPLAMLAGYAAQRMVGRDFYPEHQHDPLVWVWTDAALFLMSAAFCERWRVGFAPDRKDSVARIALSVCGRRWARGSWQWAR